MKHTVFSQIKKKNKTTIILDTLLLRVVEVEDKVVVLVVVLVELIFQIYLRIFLGILVVDNQGEEEKLIIEVLIFDMIYLLPLKKHMRVKNKILNSQQQKSALLVKEMALNLVILLIDVQRVVGMEK